MADWHAIVIEDAASCIKVALRYVPADVTLTDDEREEIDPDAAGMELYAPVHGYIFCASGRIMGAFDGILAMQRNCATSISYRGASRARRDPFGPGT